MNTQTEIIELDERGGWTSASNAQYDLLCAARHLKQAAVPDPEKRTKDAAAGDRLHLALLKRDPTGLSTDERDRYEATCVLEDKLVADYFGEHSDKARRTALREVRFWLKIGTPTGKLLKHSGKPDVVYRYLTKAMVLDYKSLYGDIPASQENMQLCDLAVLVRGHFVLIDEVAVAIIQPALSSSPDVCYYNKEQLARAEAALFERVAKNNDPAQEPVAGELQCRYCRAKKYCGAYNRFAGNLVPGMMALLEVPAVNWTPAQRAEFLDKRKIAQQWLDDRADEIKAILEKDPDGAPGYKLKPGAVREAINNPQQVFERFVGLGGTPEKFMPCITITKARLKEQVAVITGAKGKGLQGAMDTLLDGCVTRAVSAPSIIKADEPETI